MAGARTAVILRIGLALAAVAVFSSRAAAQRDESLKDVDSPGLVIEAVVGFDGLVDQSGPVPLSFLIRNDSEQIVEGQLRLSDPLNGREALLGHVVVAPGTVRRLTSIQALTDWYECFAMLSRSERVLWRRELALTGNGFRADVNYALFIDDGGRALQLPGEVSTTGEAGSAGPAANGAEGRPIDCLTVKTWQVPIHPGPLVAAQAIVLPEGMLDDSLNDVQWQAIAEWMCQGGVIFVHSGSEKAIERLMGLAPLDTEAAVSSDGFVVRRAGLGTIYEYSQPLFRSENAEVRQRISDLIAGLTKNHVSTLVDSVHFYNRGGRRADLNCLLVVGFFLCYAFFSGFVALLLFRWTQRRMGAYLAAVVAGACVLSGLLGGYLRFSQGDLYFVTVTQAGTGGAVQVGRVEVQSAGSRDTRVAVKGESADLQFIDGDTRYSRYGWYPWDRSQTAYPPFTWQPNQAPGADDSYQVNVTMTPWGRRQLHATGFRRGMGPLDFKLQFEPSGGSVALQGEAGETATLPAGKFSLTLVNNLRFDLVDCWLVISAALPPAEQADASQVTPYVRFRGPQPTGASDGLVQIYHQRPLGALAAGAKREENFEAGVSVMPRWGAQMISLRGGAMSIPVVHQPHRASAWIVAVIEDSPILAIDEQSSEFVPQSHLHLYVQEILPEDMPDASVFPGSGEAPSE